MHINFDAIKQVGNVFSAQGNNAVQKMQEEDIPLFSFKDSENKFGEREDKQVGIDENSDQYKSDAQQLNEDAVWLSELYQGLQEGEPWAIEEAKKLQVAAGPDENDNSSNAQLLRSNNDLAAAIKAMVAPDKEEK